MSIFVAVFEAGYDLPEVWGPFPTYDTANVYLRQVAEAQYIDPDDFGYVTEVKLPISQQEMRD